MRRTLSLSIVCFTMSLALNASQGSAQRISYNHHIRPILADRCFKCHGRDKANRQANLRLDRQEDAIASSIVPGNASQSELLARVRAEDISERMPPPESHKAPLNDQQIELLRQWIDEGAVYEPHWAFVPPVRPEVPRPIAPQELGAAGTHWLSHPIDAFVLARLQQEGLHPSPPADRETLIRRVTLDLTGLPPTLAEVNAFLNDPSSSAYEKVVDQLLQSDRYGEHLARYWLDAARYADTNGFQYDLNRDQWAWRDWVIHALNSNMPFDQFTIEQLAGDLLPNASDQQRLATAFNRNHPITIEGGVIEEEYRTEYVVDRVVTTSTVWLGLTMLCARCHDHKYDPISQREFYQLLAFFNNVPEKGIAAFDPKAKLTSPLRARQLARCDVQLKAAQQRYQKIIAESVLPWHDWEANVLTDAESCWSVVIPETMTSLGNALFTVQPDHSVLVGGPKPDRDTYELLLSIQTTQLRAIRLETLTDDSFGGRVGRESGGNFVLSELQLAVAPAGRLDQFNTLQFDSAEADYSQNNYEITFAIDSNLEKAGWAVDGSQRRTPSTAVFELGAPVGFTEGTELRIRMVQHHGKAHLIGRFRLALAIGEQNPPPLAMQKIIAVPVEQRSTEQQASLQDFLISRYGPAELRALGAEVTRLQERRTTLENVPITMVMAEMDQPRITHILDRGQYDKPGAVVTAGTPQALPSQPENISRNRLGLAQWLVMPRHPLTARVTVNRFWQRIFGTGLVKTTEDFGTQGEWPSHPDLLDWLAVEFVESGWNMKQWHKQVVMSATYCQSSNTNVSTQSKTAANGTLSFILDPENRLLARGPRRRLDAEMIRDSALFVSGMLIDQLGGPSVFPYQPPGLWQEINNRPGLSEVYQQDQGAGLYRRSLYTYWKRTVPPPALAMFDAPEREYCVVRRSSTNTPLQAFVLLHDPQFLEAARQLAAQMILKGGTTSRDRLMHGFRCCMTRHATSQEMNMLEQTLATRQQQYHSHPIMAEHILSVGFSPRDTSLDAAEHAAYTTVARILLNLSEFITKE